MIREAKLPAQGMAAGITTGGVLSVLGLIASPKLALTGVVAMIALLLLLAQPVLTFYVTAFMVPLERLGRLTDDSSSMTFSVMRTMGMFSLGALVVHAFLQKKKLRVPVAVILYALYCGVGILTLTHTSDPDSGVRAAGAIVGNLLFLFVAVNFIHSRQVAERAILLWLAATLAIAMLTLVQWNSPSAVVPEERFLGAGELTTAERFATVMDMSKAEALEGSKRAIGSTSNPAVYGINLILSLPFFVYFARTTANGWLRYGSLLGALVTCANIGLTNTRAAILTLIVVLVLMVVTKIVVLNVRLVGAMAALALVAYLMAPAELLERALDVSKYSTSKSATFQARLEFWQTGLRLWADNWLTGIGLGNELALPARLNMTATQQTSAHNEYLYSLMETGLLGYPLLIAFMIWVHRSCRRMENAFADDPPMRLLGTACRVALYCVLFYGMQVDVLHFPLKPWWLSVSVAVAGAEMARAAIARKEQEARA